MISNVFGKGDLKYWLLFEASGEGMLLATPDGIILDANPAACRILQRTRETILAANLDELFDPSDPQREHAREEQRRTGRFSGELRLLGQNNISVLARVSIVSHHEHDGEGAISILFQDVTETKQAERKVRESEERYRRLIELTPAIMAIHTAAPEGRWVYTNAPGARLLGAAKVEELIGKPVLDFIHPDYHEFIKRRWRRTQVEREPTEPAEIKMVRLDGEIIDVETRGIPATYEGRPATFAFIVDISERKRAEEAVRLSADLQRSREQLVEAREEERRRLRRDLHDGLGPRLASLTMRAEAARDLVPLDPTRAQEVLEGLAEQAQEAVADVRHLVYALRPPTLDALGLVEALRYQAGRLGNGSLRVSIDGPEAMPPLPAAVEVACYRIALEALTNVARHAEARNCTVRLALDEEAGALHLEVEDDGRGIGEGIRAGVGLTSMRERAEELGGSCTVEDVSFGSGTCVRAFLPCVRDDAMGNEAGEPDLKEA